MCNSLNRPVDRLSMGGRPMGKGFLAWLYPESGNRQTGLGWSTDQSVLGLEDFKDANQIVVVTSRLWLRYTRYLRDRSRNVFSDKSSD